MNPCPHCHTIEAFVVHIPIAGDRVKWYSEEGQHSDTKDWLISSGPPVIRCMGCDLAREDVKIERGEIVPKEETNAK